MAIEQAGAAPWRPIPGRRPSWQPGRGPRLWRDELQLELNLRGAGYREPPGQSRRHSLSRAIVSTPLQRYTALMGARDLLEHLADPKRTRSLPQALRWQAVNLWRHYPPEAELETIVRRGMDYRPPEPETGTIREPQPWDLG